MRLNIKVQPNSSKQEIIKLDETSYKVYLHKSPEDGKANEELLKLFKKELKLNVRIIYGHTSRNKVLEVIK